MIRKGQFGCFKVGNLNTVAKPVNQEVEVPGKVCVPAGEQQLCCENITDPVQRSANYMSAGVGRSSTAGGEDVPEHMLNTTDKLCITRKGTHMAQNSSVSSMNIMQIDKSPKTKQMKSRLEEAVRHHTGQEMRREKRYHHARSWQIFSKDDQVYVFFQQRKAGHSPKFTSYWRGPST
jgi:hypothetical protein